MKKSMWLSSLAYGDKYFTKANKSLEVFFYGNFLVHLTQPTVQQNVNIHNTPTLSTHATIWASVALSPFSVCTHCVCGTEHSVFTTDGCRPTDVNTSAGKLPLQNCFVRKSSLFQNWLICNKKYTRNSTGPKRTFCKHSRKRGWVHFLNKAKGKSLS